MAMASSLADTSPCNPNNTASVALLATPSTVTLFVPTTDVKDMCLLYKRINRHMSREKELPVYLCVTIQPFNVSLELTYPATC